MKDTLYFFTAEFPYGRGESFIENELPVLSMHFRKIIVLPLAKPGGKRMVPENVELRDVMDRSAYSSSKMFRSNAGDVIAILFREFLHCPSRLFFVKNIRHVATLLLKGFYDAKLLESHFRFDRKDVLYSFWMNDWALALAILKRKGLIDRFVFRCGGYDIYDERHPGNYLPFRHFIYSQCSGIYPNSKMGAEYIIKKKMFPEKVETQYWGTTDHGMNELSEAGTFRLVSCSNLIGLKRVELIIAVLMHVDFKLEWIHFGSGELEEKIRGLADGLPSNIRWELKGSVSNQEIIRFYQERQVNLFITTSETEGLPVSIQEAISFGIPVLATSVGGIPEVVNEKTGMLIDKDFDCKKTAALLTSFRNSERNSVLFRQGVRKFWQENFEAGKNYTYFYKKLTADTQDRP